jgi:hypothetical protein
MLIAGEPTSGLEPLTPAPATNVMVTTCLRPKVLLAELRSYPRTCRHGSQADPSGPTLFTCTTIYHELTTTTIVSQGIRRTIRASESPHSGYILGSSGPARTDQCGCKVLLISRFQVRVLGGSLLYSITRSMRYLVAMQNYRVNWQISARHAPAPLSPLHRGFSAAHWFPVR